MTLSTPSTCERSLPMIPLVLVTFIALSDSFHTSQSREKLPGVPAHRGVPCLRVEQWSGIQLPDKFLAGIRRGEGPVAAVVQAMRVGDLQERAEQFGQRRTGQIIVRLAQFRAQIE